MLARGTRIRRFLVAVLGVPLIAACGGGGDETGVGDPSPAASEPRAATAAIDVPDACTFLARAELEPLIGRELREGEPSDMPPGSSQCDFETPPGFYVTRTFDNPALPESAGFGSVTITTNQSSPENFTEHRRLLGTEAEDVPGVGGGAYFNGPAMIYVRVGNRGFSIRMHADPTTDEAWARLREVMLSLARAGASKL
jgi:hypothetical protein